MRDILFKAKIKNWRELPTEEQWVYGYYVRGFNVYEEPIHIIFDPTTIFENNKTDGWDEIDPDTLCRYTGLNDNHDNKIWENDVLCSNRKEKYFVKWRFCGFELLHRACATPIYAYAGTDLYVNEHTLNLEVLGNIFDNPELLEGGGEDE